MKKKIFKLTTIVCLSLFLLGLTITAHASVTEGRALLFNNGNPTYSGLLAANEKFKAAVAADPSDQEANLFYAVTRILASALEEGSGVSDFETLWDMFKAFGITRNDVDLVEEDSPYNDPPEIYDHYDPPEIIPSGEEVRGFLAGPFVTLIDDSIINLNKVGNDFTTILTTVETGDDYDIEVDYGDVLIFKSALYTLKSAILIATAYDLDDVDIREIVALGNADVLQIQRDLLNKYENLLKLRGTDGADGAASLTSAKDALLNGIKAYSDAFNFIITESDPQGNDLFYFESGEDQRGADFILTQLTELKNSLNENRPAVFTETQETWELTDDQGLVLIMELDKDLHGNFVEGGCGDAEWCYDEGHNFLCCGADVEHFSIVDSSVTIQVYANGGSCPCWATLTGTMSVDGANITSGTYNAQNPYGSWSGSFTGVLQSTETETETIDFNRIFGNTGKFSLDIRAILPEFDQYDEPVPGTFGIPILNGIVPEFTTNDDLTREMDLQPSGEFLIPTKTIDVQDGLVNDWSGIDPVFIDITGEDEYEFSGDDIAALYLAKDTEYLYVRMTLTEAPNTLSPDANGSMHYFVQLARWASSWSDRYFGVKYNSGSWEVMVHKNAGYEVFGDHPTGFAQAVGNDLEWKVPLSELELPFTGCYLNTWSHWTPGSYNCSDGNHTKLRVGPLASIIGTIDCSAHNTSGNIFICARDASTGKKLGKTYITSPGTYTITGLPVGANVNLFARWDADGNGIRTIGDYLGTSGPYSVESGGTTANFVIDYEIQETSISGQITCSKFQTGQGQIYIDVFDGPNRCTDNCLGDTSISAIGSYSISNLPSGSQVWVFAYWDANGSGSNGPDAEDYTGSYADNPVTLSVGGNTGINVDLNTKSLYAISGMVSDTSEAPIANISVCAERENSTKCVCACTQNDGSYVILVPAGRYLVIAISRSCECKNYVPEFYNDKSMTDEANADMVVVADDVSGIDFTLEPGGCISGRVTSDGTPCANIDLKPMEAENSYNMGWISAVTDGSGYYKMCGVPEGNYYLKTRSDHYQNKWWTSSGGTPDFYDAEAVTTIPGDQCLENIDFQLEAGYPIEGYVFETDGVTPIPGATVVARTDCTGYRASAVTSPDGHYKFDPLPAATYTVYAWAKDHVSRFRQITVDQIAVSNANFFLPEKTYALVNTFRVQAISGQDGVRGIVFDPAREILVSGNPWHWSLFGYTLTGGSTSIGCVHYPGSELPGAPGAMTIGPTGNIFYVDHENDLVELTWSCQTANEWNLTEKLGVNVSSGLAYRPGSQTYFGIETTSAAVHQPVWEFNTSDWSKTLAFYTSFELGGHAWFISEMCYNPFNGNFLIVGASRIWEVSPCGDIISCYELTPLFNSIDHTIDVKGIDVVTSGLKAGAVYITNLTELIEEREIAELTTTFDYTLKGDVDGANGVNLADAIFALQVLAGLNPDGIHLSADINEDGKIGLAEVVYILQHVAGLR